MIAVVESADKDVVPELGVPLPPLISELVGSFLMLTRAKRLSRCNREDTHGPISDGVSEGGGGRLISVGVVMIVGGCVRVRAMSV